MRTHQGIEQHQTIVERKPVPLNDCFCQKVEFFQVLGGDFLRVEEVLDVDNDDLDERLLAGVVRGGEQGV